VALPPWCLEGYCARHAKRNPALTDASSTPQFFSTVWVQGSRFKSFICHIPIQDAQWNAFV